MKWDQHNPEGRGTPRVSDGWMRQFIRREAEKQAEMLVRIRERVERDLDAKPEGVPGKDTMRAARFALDGFVHIAQLELDAAKLRLLAERSKVHAPMTDEQFAAQIEALGRQAVGALSVEELEAELARKRALPAPAETATYHREHGHPVPADHPAAVSRWDVDPAIRPTAPGQLPALRPCDCPPPEPR